MNNNTPSQHDETLAIDVTALPTWKAESEQFAAFSDVQIERRQNDIARQLRANGISNSRLSADQQSARPWNLDLEPFVYVDSSLERLQLTVTGFTESRYKITCNGYELPLRATATAGEYVVGVRYRAWQPTFALHPDLPVDTPLIFDVIDTWSQRSLGGCSYHVSDPGGRNYEDVPVNANVAEARRLARFEPDHHTPAPSSIIAPNGPIAAQFNETEPLNSVTTRGSITQSSEYPCTADLRQLR
ncbi:MAG: transglutaminase family protein [Granulosicoccus sp.]|nr:transglutaminase family protein [Granulosicoccus sp.]